MFHPEAFLQPKSSFISCDLKEIKTHSQPLKRVVPSPHCTTRVGWHQLPTESPQQPPRSPPESPLATRVSFEWAQRQSRAPGPSDSVSCWNHAALKQDRKNCRQGGSNYSQGLSQVLALLWWCHPPIVSSVGGCTAHVHACAGRGYDPAFKPVPVSPAARLPACPTGAPGSQAQRQLAAFAAATLIPLPENEFTFAGGSCFLPSLWFHRNYSTLLRAPAFHMRF